MYAPALMVASQPFHIRVIRQGTCITSGPSFRYCLLSSSSGLATTGITRKGITRKDRSLWLISSICNVSHYSEQLKSTKRNTEISRRQGACILNAPFATQQTPLECNLLIHPLSPARPISEARKLRKSTMPLWTLEVQSSRIMARSRLHCSNNKVLTIDISQPR